MAPTTAWRIEASRPCRMTPGKFSAPAASHPTRSKPMLTASHASRSDDSVVWRGWSDGMWADLQRHPVGLPPRVRCTSLSLPSPCTRAVGRRAWAPKRTHAPRLGVSACRPAPEIRGAPLRGSGKQVARGWCLAKPRAAAAAAASASPTARVPLPLSAHLDGLLDVAPCASHSLTAGVIKESEKKKVGQQMPKTFLQLTTPPKTHH